MGSASLTTVIGSVAAGFGSLCFSARVDASPGAIPSSAPATVDTLNQRSEPGTHIKTSEDTLSSIAKKYDVDLKELLKLNALEESDIVSDGFVVRVPDRVTVNAATTQAIQLTQHKIKAGETLTAIAEQYKTNVQVIVDLNPNLKANPNKIQAGKTLRVPSLEAEDAGENNAKPTVMNPQVTQPLESNFHATLTDFIKKNEGFRPSVYIDTQGYPTIGYGHKLCDTKMGLTQAKKLYGHLLVSEAAAAKELTTDIDNALSKCSKYPWFKKLNQAMQVVVVDMTFNLGSLEEFKDLRACLAKQDWKGASWNVLNTREADGTERLSLYYTQVKGRAERNAAIIFRGKQ